MDEYDYESDSYEEDMYDDELDTEPFFGNLLKTQSEIEEQRAKEIEEKRKCQEEAKQLEKTKQLEQAKKSSEVATVHNDLPVSEDDVSDAQDDDYEEQDSKVFDKRKSIKKDRRCLLCSTINPKIKYFTLKGAKCRKDDIEGKLHKLLGTIPVFCLPGNPYICEPCYKRTLDCYSMWDMSITGITEYLEEEEPEDVPRSDIKVLENKLQRVVKKFLLEKLSRLDEDVTIMGNVYVSLGDRAMVMFPIDSTAEIENLTPDDDDDDDDDAQEDDRREEPAEDPAETSFRSEDVGGILDANMGNIDFNFDDIEVDVEYFGSSTNDKNDSLTVDLEAMMIKTEPGERDQVDDDIELDVETEPGSARKDSSISKVQPDKSQKTQVRNEKDIKREEKKKKEPSVTVNISYKDIQKAEEALIKNNTTEGRCPACKILFFPGEYIRHTDTSERRKCEYCVFQTSLICVLRKHEKKNHKNAANNKTFNAVNNTAKALFKCDKCSKCFVTHFLLNKHRIFFHGTKSVYPEYVKARVDDELSLGSSDGDQSEEEVGTKDPDYRPNFWDDDYVPSVKVKKRKTVQRAYSGTGGGGTRKRSMVWHYFELTNNYLEDRQTARCLMCGREVARKQSSTWAMMTHLKQRHKDIDLSVEPPVNGGRSENRGLVNGETIVQQASGTSKGNQETGSSRKKADEQDSQVSSTMNSLAPDTQFVVGSYGEIQLATPEVIKSLKERGIQISKFECSNPNGGRQSPTSAAVASITETDQAVRSLLEQQVQISNAEGVSIPISELLDSNTQVSSIGADQQHKQPNASDDKFVTQYVKDRKTGELLQLRIPKKSIESTQTQESTKDSVSAGT